MDFDQLSKRLPTGMESFVDIRRSGAIYVDKTPFLLKLARRRAFIVTRPRRFGKSTLQSALEELFLHGIAPYDGHDSYFKGLAIEPLWQDHGQYLVLRLDFQQLSYQCEGVKQFELKLNDALVKFCQEHELTVPEKTRDSSDFFGQMFQQLSHRSLVLLVDEYDAPLLSLVNKETELAACKELMRGWFGSIKLYVDKFRCVFFTGITRYQDLGIGTAGNNFTDLTNDEDFAGCCGYTRDELKQYFADNLRYAASVHAGCAPEEVSAAQIDALLDEMAAWYDGYSFDGEPHNKVFSTWSVLRFFSSRKASFEGYWSLEESLGLPQLLKLCLDRVDLPKLLTKLADGNGEISVSKDEFLQSSLVNPQANPYSVLCQLGYLTLSQPFSGNPYVHLTCPNEEIRLALSRRVARQLFQQDDCYCPQYCEQALATLSRNDPDEILAHFRKLFKAVSHEHCALDRKRSVAALLSFHLFALGLKPRLEAGQNVVSFDLPAHDLTIVFEYKFEESDNLAVWDSDLEKAIEQIRERDYGNNATSMRTVARFALIYCAAPSQRTIVRVGQESVFDRY